VNVGEETAMKIRSAKIRRNPLKSLDSDERIQGNPSFSNASKLSFRSEKATRQENPNEAAGPRQSA
jgi:hypothetical protein